MGVPLLLALHQQGLSARAGQLIQVRDLFLFVC